MAPWLIRSVLSLIAIIGLAFPIRSAQAAGYALPSLAAFAHELITGNSAQLVGVYAPELFARSVVQQPPGNSSFVSTAADVVTQFSRASELGSTALLAHNYLAGSQFSSLFKGELIYLVFGDGRTVAYVVSELDRYRALQPNSSFSAFEDLRDGQHIGASDLFSRIYDRPGALVLQTCIEAEGNISWGRLFVIALPVAQPRTFRFGCSACR